MVELLIGSALNYDIAAIFVDCPTNWATTNMVHADRGPVAPDRAIPVLITISYPLCRLEPLGDNTHTVVNVVRYSNGNNIDTALTIARCIDLIWLEDWRTAL